MMCIFTMAVDFLAYLNIEVSHGQTSFGRGTKVCQKYAPKAPHAQVQLDAIALAGSAVAVAGPIGFIGLVIPHAVRFFVGVDYRWILPYAALLGAIFLVLADVVARLVLRPTELPVGVMTALIGGPFFIYLVRWKVKR